MTTGPALDESTLRDFAQTCDAIAHTPGKIAKIALVADYLRSLDDANLEAATRYFTGNPFAAKDDRTLALGGRTIVAAAESVWGIPDGALGLAYRERGDLGAALGGFVRPPVDLGLFRTILTPASLKTILDAIADTHGKAAARKRQVLCERILAACADELEARYAIKILTGDLRIGLREGLVLDAIAAAFERAPEVVRRAAMAAGDVGSVALAARADGLDDVAIAYGTPIGFMLASPIVFGSSYKELEGAGWLVEDKYDGVRIQAHVDGDRVRLFSRTLNDVSRAFPEVVDALRKTERRAIYDGEIIALRDDRVLPFRFLQARLQRKDVAEELLHEVPVRFVVFDLLAHDNAFVLDDPLATRRGLLAEILQPAAALEIAPWTALDADPSSVNERFERARERGNEGLVLKRADAPYVPGRRGKWWLKLKRELSTLDVVVVGVEWGHGKRAKVLSDYTFAVRDASGELLTIGKAYSGLTDVEIAEMTTWFLDHRTGMLNRHAFAVEPTQVIEIAFDILQPSTLHESGYSLRFPRIVRLRPDKPASEIDTLARVEDIYREMLERENVGGAATSSARSGAPADV